MTPQNRCLLESEIQRLLQIFNNGSIINPFLIETETQQLPCSGVVLPENISTKLLNAERLGTDQYHSSVGDATEISCWSPLKHLNIDTCASVI